MTGFGDPEVENFICVPRNYTADQCEYEKDVIRMENAEKESLSQNGGGVEKCRKESCNLGFYVFDDPMYTINSIIGFLQSELSRGHNWM